jgi:hypothetical protein
MTLEASRSRTVAGGGVVERAGSSRGRAEKRDVGYSCLRNDSPYSKKPHLKFFVCCAPLQTSEAYFARGPVSVPQPGVDADNGSFHISRFACLPWECDKQKCQTQIFQAGTIDSQTAVVGHASHSGAAAPGRPAPRHRDGEWARLRPLQRHLYIVQSV